jgi:hypothetical protein
MSALSNFVFLQYLTTVFDSLDELILLISVEPDGKYKILVTNKTYMQISGRTESPAGKYVSDVVSPDTWDELREKYETVVATKKPLEFTQTYKVPLGKQTYKVKLLPILNSVGEVVQIAGIASNVTVLKNLQDQVEQLRKKNN